MASSNMKKSNKIHWLTPQSSFKLSPPPCPKNGNMGIQNSGTTIALIGKFLIPNCAIIVDIDRLVNFNWRFIAG